MNDKKASYTLRSNIRFLFGLQWKTSKHSLTLLVITIPCAIMLSFLAAYFPKTVAYNIINNIGLFETIISIVYISLDIAILNIIIQVITVYNTALMANFRREVTYLINKKILQTDYENIENPDFRQLMQRAKQAVWGSGSGSTVERFSEITIKIVIHILTFFMFATVLALVNPYLIAILLSLSILNYYLVNKVEKYQYKNRKKISAIDQKLWYIAHNSGDISGAKDIRLFNMQNMFTSLFEKFTKERLNFSKKSPLNTIT